VIIGELGLTPEMIRTSLGHAAVLKKHLSGGIKMSIQIILLFFSHAWITLVIYMWITCSYLCG
jgi:hypothetical protein